jgi:peptidoglycan/LPS O-acetylase OafA/YrhL
MVFVFHYGGGLQSQHWPLRVLGYVTQAGWTGVVLFFALSGFLITGSLWDSLGTRHVLRNFYARRALRIFPLYFLALMLAVVVALARGSTFLELRQFAIYAMFLQDIPPFAARAVATASPLPLYHLWSLAVEEQFYLLWPALLLLARSLRTALWLSLGVFMASCVFCEVVWGVPIRWLVDGHVLDNFLLTHAGALALGAALALGIRSRAAATVKQLAPWLLVFGLISYIGVCLPRRSFLLVSHVYDLALPSVWTSAVALVALAMRPGFAGDLLTLAPLRWMGRISYGFYVFHILLQPVFDKIAVRVAPPAAGYSTFLAARFLAAFFITLMVSWISYRYFEQPILALKRRFPMHSPLP